MPSPSDAPAASGSAKPVSSRAAKLARILQPGIEVTEQNGALCVLPGDRLPHDTAGVGLLGRLQNRLKRRGALYLFLVKLLSPVLASRAFRHHLQAMLAVYGPDHVVLNLGSGPFRLFDRADVINVDLFAFDEVDLVAEAEHLPIDDGTVDCILNLAVLEHVQEPKRVIQEMHRLLRPGGQALCYLPFLVPYHAAPHDYHRWTRTGVEADFAAFADVEVVVGAGPTSAALWLAVAWLALACSFGNRTLHDVLLMGLMVVTAPLKLLDVVLATLPGAEQIASGFAVVARK